MKILSILFSFALIECSVGAPVLGCSSELEGFKEVVKAKADIKASLVAALLEQVNAIDIQTKDGDTLLMLAARNGLTDVVDELLNLKAIVTVSKDTIAAASKLANEAGFQEVVEILRSASVEVNEKDEDGNAWTPPPCEAPFFLCLDKSACVPAPFVCDNNADCHDGSDERNCLASPPGDQTE